MRWVVFIDICTCSYKSGLVLAMVCIVLIIVPLGLSIQLVLEAMARGSIVWEYEESRKSGEEGDDAALLGTKSNPSPTRHRFANSNEDGDYDHNKTGNGYKLNDSQELLLVGERKIELVDLAEIFMGRKGKLAFVSFVRYLSSTCPGSSCTHYVCITCTTAYTTMDVFGFTLLFFLMPWC